MVNHHSTNRRIRSVWTGPQSPVGHVCQTAVVALCVLILVFAPLAFGAVRLWALGPILIMIIGMSSILWQILLGGDDLLPEIELRQPSRLGI
jgi:hypothetical protein